jgi:hypothetical protein
VRGFSKDPLGGGQQREKRFLVENLVTADSFRRRRAEPVSPASPAGMANAQKAHGHALILKRQIANHGQVLGLEGVPTLLALAHK